MMLAAGFSVTATNLIYCCFDFCALFVCAVVLINYFTSRRQNTRTSFWFKTLIISGVVSTVVHCLAVVFNAVVPAPEWLASAFVAIYYVCFNIAGIAFFLFSVSVVYGYGDFPRFALVLAAVFGCLNLIAVVFELVAHFAVAENVALQLTAKIIVYVSQFAALVAASVVTIVHRKNLRVIQRVNVYCFLFVNLVATVLQFWYQKLQMTSFALSIAILLIYISLHRPEDEIDQASDLFNRRSFTKTGAMLVKSNTPFLIFAFQINNFSLVNSKFGVLGGNAVIAEVANRFRNTLPDNNYLYRLEGVQFAAIFTDRRQVEDFKFRYKHMFDAPVTIGETGMKFTATSVLVAVPEITANVIDVCDILRFYHNSEKADDLIIEADEDSVKRLARKEQVEYAIDRALENHGFSVYYQPIWSVKEKRFSCCEALIRLIDPQLGFIPPDEFIPVAEQNGKIIAIGRYVVEEVCRFIKEKQPERYGIEFVDVNVSVIQCMHPDIITDIEGILSRFNIPRSMVNLEVTETASAQSYALMQSRLSEFHSNGFTVSLDDFGSGFSSVEYLINFPFDVVKLDKSLVWAYMSTEKYEPILQHYMPMLHGLGVKIIAEGVETEEMVNSLSGLGCDYLQGYYYSRPISESAFMDFIISHANQLTA